MNITEIDANFKVPDNVKRDDLVWHDVRTAPVSIYGLCDPRNAETPFHRFPFEVGERFAQLVIMPAPAVHYTEVEKLSESERGENGYGSTGK